MALIGLSFFGILIWLMYGLITDDFNRAIVRKERWEACDPTCYDCGVKYGGVKHIADSSWHMYPLEGDSKNVLICRKCHLQFKYEQRNK